MIPSWIQNDNREEFREIFCDDTEPNCKRCSYKQRIINALIQDITTYVSNCEIQARDYGQNAPSPRFTSRILDLR